MVLAGLIDPHYREEVASLINSGGLKDFGWDLQISLGSLLVLPCPTVKLLEDSTNLCG